MIRFLPFTAAAVFALAACTAQPHTAIQADLLIENVNIVPMTHEAVVADQAVAVRDGQIIAILDQAEAGRVEAAQHVDAAGQYLLPGLADMHTHLRMPPQAAFNLYLANGVTTVTNLGLADDFRETGIDHLALRTAVRTGSMTGPRYRVSGPQLNSGNVPDIEAAETVISEHLAADFDVMKIHGDLASPVYDTLMAAAEVNGIAVTGHVQRLRPLDASLGMTSIEHAEEFLYAATDEHFAGADASLDAFLEAYLPYAERLRSAEARAPVVEIVAASDVFLAPTLTVYGMIATWGDDTTLAEHAASETLTFLPPGDVEYWTTDSNPYRAEGFPLSPDHVRTNVETLHAFIGELHGAGVPLLLGTDSFGSIVPGFSVHTELAHFRAAGLSPFEALQTSTINVALYLDEADMRGTIETGKLADFILLADNPLETIDAVRDVRGVYTHGRWHDRRALDAMLAEARALSEEAG